LSRAGAPCPECTLEPWEDFASRPITRIIRSDNECPSCRTSTTFFIILNHHDNPLIISIPKSLSSLNLKFRHFMLLFINHFSPNPLLRTLSWQRVNCPMIDSRLHPPWSSLPLSYLIGNFLKIKWHMKMWPQFPYSCDLKEIGPWSFK
jgi:hypothetical protein